MKKIIYTIIATSLLLTSCINRDEVIEDAIDPAGHPVVTITLADPSMNGATVNEGDGVIIPFNITLSRALDYNVNISAIQTGGDADADDFTYGNVVIPKYTNEAVFNLSIIPDAIDEDTETLSLKVGAFSLSNRYLVQEGAETTFNITIENCDTCTTCDWTLDMQDSYGDGWNGAAVEFTQAGITSIYDLDNYSDDGVTGLAMVPLANQTDFTVGFVSGSYDGEVSFQLTDPNGVEVLNVTAPLAGELYSGSNVCP